MWRLQILALVSVAVSLLAAAPDAHAGKRVALVIGNGAYARVVKLDNPARDARAVEKMLRGAGFDAVEVHRDLGRDALRRALRNFSDLVRGADIAVVFYAGHGIEVDGANYLVPVDAALERDIDVEDEAVPLERVTQLLEPARRLRLVILDACRENPFIRSMRRTMTTRSVGRGLARVEVLTPDTLIAFAAKAGSTAADGTGTNSPYTAALVEHLATPGLDVRLALGRVRDEVLHNTGNRQEPYVYGSLGGSEIPLVPAVSAADAARPPSDAAEAARICREVEGMSSLSMLGVLARQHAGKPAAECIAARRADLERIAAEAAGKKKAAEGAEAKADAERVCSGIQSIADVVALEAMAAHHRGTAAEACIAARIAALEGQIERLGGKALGGMLHGIAFAPSPFGPAAVFRRERESRIQFDFDEGFPREGTLELVFKVDKGYWYTKGVLKADQRCALLFTTDIQGGDVTWPGSTWLYVCRDGEIRFHIAGEGYQGGWNAKYALTTPSPFRFGQWHRLSVSFGSAGRHIRLDGRTIASSGQTHMLGAGGNHRQPTDRPTIGESVSGFWPNNLHEGGFEGMLYQFRASPRQLDFVLNR